MVHRVALGERQLRVASVHAGAAGKHQVLHLLCAAALQDVAEAQEIGVGVIVGLVDGVAHAGLCRQMQHPMGTHPRKQRMHGVAVGDIDLLESEVALTAQAVQARVLQADVIVGIEVIDAHHPFAALQQSLRAMHADEAGAAGDQGDAHGCVPRGLQMYS